MIEKLKLAYFPPIPIPTDTQTKARFYVQISDF